MSGEEGLRGSWFTGTVTQLQHAFALVAYDELNVSEDSDEKLQEWFPLLGAAAEDLSLLGPTHDANFGPDFHIRPSPPAEVGQSKLLGIAALSIQHQDHMHSLSAQQLCAAQRIPTSC